MQILLANAMVRYILENGITSPDELKAFSYEGFEPSARRSQYSPNHGDESFPHFIRN